jgi:hypothetical protein
MNGSRKNNHSTPPADPKTRHAAQRTGSTASEKDEPHPSLISLKCPNPGCGRTYTVPYSMTSKKARCKCGAVFPVATARTPRPGATASPAPKQPSTIISPVPKQSGAAVTRGMPAAKTQLAPRAEPAAKTQLVPRAEPAPLGGPEVTEVQVGCIGRGNAGKTALFRVLCDGPAADFFPSGLHVDAGDPREVAQLIREAGETERLLHQCGLPPTLKASQIRYCLYDGAELRVAYKLREVIGQVLSHTLPDSAAEQQTRYSEYLRSLLKTDVLWAVVPCLPPNPSTRDRRRYANDLHITLAYLREALRLRAREQPVAVALVLSKIDVLFKDAEEARSSLTDDVLRTSMGPLVNLVEQSPCVSDAVIVPVSAFGFGNAVLRDDKATREGPPSESGGEPFGSELIWLLRDGVSAQPYNLHSLFVWTLLYGLLNHEGPGALARDTERRQTCQTLCQDLDAINPWFLPLTGGVERQKRRPQKVQSA